MTLDSAVVKARKFYSNKQFIRTTNTGNRIREEIRVAGWSKGLVRKNYRVFRMGHVSTSAVVGRVTR